MTPAVRRHSAIIFGNLTGKSTRSASSARNAGARGDIGAPQVQGGRSLFEISAVPPHVFSRRLV